MFPVCYNDKFYKDVLEVGELAKLGEFWRKRTGQVGSGVCVGGGGARGVCVCVCDALKMRSRVRRDEGLHVLKEWTWETAGAVGAWDAARDACTRLEAENLLRRGASGLEEGRVRRRWFTPAPGVAQSNSAGVNQPRCTARGRHMAATHWA